MPALDENDAATCEGKVTLEETTAALNKMKNGSAPGYDGITTEFMKFFWSKIGTLVTNSFIEAFDRAELSYTLKQGVIILLHKGNELNKEDLNNRRLQILAKVLAETLSGVIPKLISEDQVGYIRGRNIATVIMTIDDVINYFNRTKKINKKNRLYSCRRFPENIRLNIKRFFIAYFQSIWVRSRLFKNGSQS